MLLMLLTHRIPLLSDKPHNPMLNSGAIMVAALLHSLHKSEMRLAEKFDYMQNYYKVIKACLGCGHTSDLVCNLHVAMQFCFAISCPQCSRRADMKSHPCNQPLTRWDIPWDVRYLHEESHGLSAGQICDIPWNIPISRLNN
jgi:transcription elongation factor Elf1